MSEAGRLKIGWARLQSVAPGEEASPPSPPVTGARGRGTTLRPAEERRRRRDGATAATKDRIRGGRLRRQRPERSESGETGPKGVQGG